jgi:hypothetical protein
VDGWAILPNSARVHFHRIVPGGTGPSDFYDAVFATDPTSTGLDGSVMAWNGDGWDLRLRDGTTLVFANEGPLRAIRDRYGNTITITRAPTPTATSASRVPSPRSPRPTAAGSRSPTMRPTASPAPPTMPAAASATPTTAPATCTRSPTPTAIDAGEAAVEVEEAFPLDGAAEAHRRGESHRTRGKLVLRVAP